MDIISHQIKFITPRGCQTGLWAWRCTILKRTTLGLVALCRFRCSASSFPTDSATVSHVLLIWDCVSRRSARTPARLMKLVVHRERVRHGTPHGGCLTTSIDSVESVLRCLRAVKHVCYAVTVTTKRSQRSRSLLQVAPWTLPCCWPLGDAFHVSARSAMDTLYQPRSRAYDPLYTS